MKPNTMKWRNLLFSITLLAASALALLPQADSSSRGKDVFEQYCAKCHDLDRDKEGPRLRGIVGRRAASVTSFAYSESLKKANLQWNEENLNQWLANPEKVAPDNDMAFHLDNEADRRAVIAYLKTVPGK